MILLLYPVSLLAAACWGVAAHRRTICRDDQADYEAQKPPGHIWWRTIHRYLDQQRRAWHTAVALTSLLAGRVR